MTAIALVFGPLTFSLSAFAVFLVLTGVTLLFGHSLGLHRKLIHGSFQCLRWLDRLMIYLGTLVGMDGPIGMMRQHDIRDWAQRVPGCHPYVRHGSPMLKDYWWQVHCDVAFDVPPAFVLEPERRSDGFLHVMERSWMLQQLPLAVLLYLLGGWGFVVWGVCARVALSVTGHWYVGHLAHNHGPSRWHIRGAGVQGRDVPLLAALSMGEGWHANHHAFPGSARLGLDDDQPDPGWWALKAMQRVGLVWGLVTPSDLEARSTLVRLRDRRSGCAVVRRVLRVEV
ncbi:fatty acid desaturase [Parvularcula maris]|uniref:Acyl-CoA desaturase n=1 Tax=Parvularcula maris TaxID=2965077 RepID=A0A9X2RK82_9PROT|nr:acyl-CoA desaturase [Parvularcula maris]MCQ8185372.1 acyl-CoA desaturase [Parvularcula maris]